MLQLGGNLRCVTVRLSPLSSWQLRNHQPVASCSGAAKPNPVPSPQPQNNAAPDANTNGKNRPENAMIKAAFENLKDSISRERSIIDRIRSAKTVNSLLNIANDKNVTRENAFAVVKQLVFMVNSGKTTITKFETDDRFRKLQAMLTKPGEHRHEVKRMNKNMKNLELFCSMPETDEAIKEVANITVKQMVQVMSSLASQKRRSTPILRSLVYNISRSPEVLNAKQLSDLLYSMSVLNYPDEVLLQRICIDLMDTVKEADMKPALIGSVLTSLGMLRYKNEPLMDKLSEWAVRNASVMRSQDLCALFMTLAMIGYTPLNIAELTRTTVEPLQESDMRTPAEWLDIVWAFTVLGIAQDRHVASVLESRFINKLSGPDEMPVLKKQKLLNINGAAKLLIKDYKGPLLDGSSELLHLTVPRSKEKQTFAWSVVTTLELIFRPKATQLIINVDTGLGFVLDAEFSLVKTGNQLLLTNDAREKEGIRIAVFAQCYHDLCRGKQDPVGFYNLYYRMLKAKGYKILSIPHTEFRQEDKNVERLAFVNDRIKAIVAT